MIHKSAIIEVRNRLGIPEDGYPSATDALSWYKKHYKDTKKKPFKGSFGFNYDPASGMIDFEYGISDLSFTIFTPFPIDLEVQLDQNALSIGSQLKLPEWAIPAVRLVILQGPVLPAIDLKLPDHLVAPLNGLAVLVHAVNEVPLRKWRRVGESLGVLKGKARKTDSRWITTTYSSKRENKKEQLYWQTQSAYMDAIGQRRQKGIKGRRGLLVETAKILVSDYGWEFAPDSYTVRRYLDRAEKIWQVSTRKE